MVKQISIWYETHVLQYVYNDISDFRTCCYDSINLLFRMDGDSEIFHILSSTISKVMLWMFLKDFHVFLHETLQWIHLFIFATES